MASTRACSRPRSTRRSPTPDRPWWPSAAGRGVALHGRPEGLHQAVVDAGGHPALEDLGSTVGEQQFVCRHRPRNERRGDHVVVECSHLFQSAEASRPGLSAVRGVHVGAPFAVTATRAGSGPSRTARMTTSAPGIPCSTEAARPVSPSPSASAFACGRFPPPGRAAHRRERDAAPRGRRSCPPRGLPLSHRPRRVSNHAGAGEATALACPHDGGSSSPAGAELPDRDPDLDPRRRDPLCRAHSRVTAVRESAVHVPGGSRRAVLQRRGTAVPMPRSARPCRPRCSRRDSDRRAQPSSGEPGIARRERR